MGGSLSYILVHRDGSGIPFRIYQYITTLPRPHFVRQSLRLRLWRRINRRHASEDSEAQGADSPVDTTRILSSPQTETPENYAIEETHE